MTVTDLLVGIGLVFVIEGLIWALFPDFAMKMLEAASQTPPDVLRFTAVVAMTIGVVIIWLVRG